jgi:HAD superfamily hydrolase (TIGR01549 family)
MDTWRPVRGVIFDMDGTLTVPAIDFVEMRRRLGIPSGDILATVKAWPPDRREAAFAVIEELEEHARRVLAIQEGAVELLAFLDERSIPKAIMTRNTRRTVDHLMRHLGCAFSVILTRDFEPVKPHPAPVLHICAHWGLAPADVLVVGDYRDDLTCGRAAGARTCLLRNRLNAAYADEADLVADSLRELRTWLAGPAGR